MPIRKSQKAENNCYQFSFTLHKCFVFVICRYFTTFKWLKVLKFCKICLKMIQAMTPKTFDFSKNGYDSIYTVDLTRVAFKKLVTAL